MAFSTVQGSGANDATSFVGTSGVDTVQVQNTDSNILVGGQQGADVVGFTNYKNLVTGYTLKGGQGNDQLTSTGQTTNIGGASFINGNKDADTITLGNTTTSTVHGGQGADTLVTNTVFSSIVNGNKNADSLTIAAATTGSVFGGQGADTITMVGATTSSTVSGDLDNDTIAVQGNVNGSVINGNAGTDTLSVTAGTAVWATSSMRGGGGNDTVNATNAIIGIEMYGDLGNDTLNGGTSDDNITGGAGDDTVTGNGGNDTIVGTAGTNSLIGNAGQDNITGGTGADSVDAGVGADAVNGGAGADQITQDNVDSIVGAFSHQSSDLDCGDTFTFANGVDVVAGFTTLTDDFITGSTGVAYLAENANMEDQDVNENYAIRGEWNADNSVFTVGGTGGAGINTGDDTLVMADSAHEDMFNVACAGGWFVVTGENALQNGDFI